MVVQKLSNINYPNTRQWIQIIRNRSHLCCCIWSSNSIHFLLFFFCSYNDRFKRRSSIASTAFSCSFISRSFIISSSDSWLDSCESTYNAASTSGSNMSTSFSTFLFAGSIFFFNMEPMKLYILASLILL